MLTSNDIATLSDPRLDVAGLQAYFASRPPMSRRELAQIKPIVARLRYKEVNSGAYALLSDEKEPS